MRITSEVAFGNGAYFLGGLLRLRGVHENSVTYWVRDASDTTKRYRAVRAMHASLIPEIAAAKKQLKKDLLAKKAEQALIINTDCSGMEAPIQALKNMGVPFAHHFSSETDPHARETIAANFAPEKKFYKDMNSRKNDKAPGCHLYVAGFPCQPYSLAGKKEGLEDTQGRGKIFWSVRRYIRKKLPATFLLENVQGLGGIKGGKDLKIMLAALKRLRKYNIYHKLLNTKEHGVPQNRPRLYIVGIREDRDKGTFAFPEPIPCPSIECFLEPRDLNEARTGMPPEKQGTALRNVKRHLEELRGKDPHTLSFARRDLARVSLRPSMARASQKIPLLHIRPQKSRRLRVRMCSGCR